MSALPEIKREKTEVVGESKKPPFVVKANTKRGVALNELSVTACETVLCCSSSGFTRIFVKQF